MKTTIVKLQSEGMTSDHERSIIATKEQLLKLHRARRKFLKVLMHCGIAA